MNRKGFTLIELMIVVVIIGILAALAIPRFLEASKKAKITEAKGVVKQLYNLCSSFYQESGHYPAAAVLTKATSATDFTPTWFDATGTAIADSINFDLPSGKPRFDYSLVANGGAHAAANTQDGSLSGVTVDINAGGILSSYVP